jgi:hypothetical protein
VRRADVILVFIALCVALLACKKGKDKAEDKAAAASVAAPAPEPPARYTAGDVLKYMPNDCTEGRFFVSVVKLIGTNKPHLDKIKSQLLAGTDPDTKEASAAFKELEAGGFDLARDIQEVAVCNGYQGEAVVALGLNLDQVTGDPLQLLTRAVEKGGEPKPTVQKKDGISYVKPAKDPVVIALVKPTVLVIAKDMTVVATAMKGQGTAAFGPASKHLAYGDVEEGDKITFTATEAGSNVDIAISILPKGKKPEDMKMGLEAMRLETVKELSQGPFKDLAGDAKKVNFTVEGSRVVAKLSLPRSRIDKLFADAAAKKPEELLQAL